MLAFRRRVRAVRALSVGAIALAACATASPRPAAAAGVTGSAYQQVDFAQGRWQVRGAHELPSVPSDSANTLDVARATNVTGFSMTTYGDGGTSWIRQRAGDTESWVRFRHGGGVQRPVRRPRG